MYGVPTIKLIEQEVLYTTGGCWDKLISVSRGGSNIHQGGSALIPNNLNLSIIITIDATMQKLKFMSDFDIELAGHEFLINTPNVAYWAN